MTPQEYIIENFKNLKEGARNITKEYQFSEDLLSEAILIFLQHETVQELVDSGKGRFFIGKTMVNLWQSDRSPFHKMYRRSKELETWWFEIQEIVPNSVNTEKDAEEFKARKLAENKERLFKTRLKRWLEPPENYYFAKLYQMRFVEGKNLSQISRETQIPRSTVHREIKKLNSHIKEIWRNIEKK